MDTILHADESALLSLESSSRGSHCSPRRLQELVKETATEAGIAKNVYPHRLRHTMAQHLTEQGMPENLLQTFLGHEHPASTQVYYEPARTQVKRAFHEAMRPPNEVTPLRP